MYGFGVLFVDKVVTLLSYECKNLKIDSYFSGNYVVGEGHVGEKIDKIFKK